MTEADTSRAAVDPELLREVRRIQIRTDRLVTDVVAGGYHSVFRGSGIEFDEVREWVEGDDFRSVDWNVTARTGRPFVKKYVEERELTILFLLDRSRSMSFGTARIEDVPKSLRRVAVEFCACLGLSANRNNDKVGLLTFGDESGADGRGHFVRPKKGRVHLLRILRDCLAPLAPHPPAAPDDGTRLREALRFTAHVLRRRAVVFVLSDWLFDLPEKELRLVARRHDLTIVPCFDPRLESLPPAGLMRLTDLETGEVQVVDTSSAEVREAYARKMRARRDKLHDSARRLGADWLELSTAESVSSAVVGFFRRRELGGAGR